MVDSLNVHEPWFNVIKTAITIIEKLTFSLKYNQFWNILYILSQLRCEYEYEYKIKATIIFFKFP